MALTGEELIAQANILVSKISDNPNMPYKPNAILNKGLDPEYFSGQYTKIVNALNQLAEDVDKTMNAVTDVMDKVNNIILDTSNEDNNRVFKNLQNLAGAATIIEGLQNILQGNTQKQVLNLREEDIDKFLYVHSENNKLIVKAMDSIFLSKVIDASEIKYENELESDVNNIKEIIDVLVEKSHDPLFWDEIQNIPDLANHLTLEEGVMELKDNDKVLSSIQVTVDEDIMNIIDNLN